MAIRGVNLAEKEEFIHPSDPGHPDQIKERIGDKDMTQAKRDELTAKYLKEDPPTKYFIGNLTATDRVEFGDMSATPTMRDGGITMDLRNTKKAYEVVQRGLKGWENQLDANGKPVEFKTSTGTDAQGGFIVIVDPECMVHLPQKVIMDLSLEIQKKNGMVAELAKKSDAQSLASDALNSAIGSAETGAAMNSEQNADA